MGGYLSSEALVNWFNKSVMETVNWPTISSTMNCLVRPALGGSDLRLEIRYVMRVKIKFINFVTNGIFCYHLGHSMKMGQRAVISPCSSLFYLF